MSGTEYSLQDRTVNAGSTMYETRPPPSVQLSDLCRCCCGYGMDVSGNSGCEFELRSRMALEDVGYGDGFILAG